MSRRPPSGDSPSAQDDGSGCGRPERATYVVDRIENRFVVLIPDDERFEDESVPASVLPKGISEGAVLMVPSRGDGTLVWEEAELDEEARLRRLREAQQRLDRLAKRDPGGDITL